MDGQTRVRVNISVTADTHLLMKRLAARRGVNVSQLLADLVRREGDPGRGAALHPWLGRIPADTLERVEQYAFEHHTSPEQAVGDWIWGRKVLNANIRGQASLF